MRATSASIVPDDLSAFAFEEAMLFAASRVEKRNEQAGLRRTRGTEYPLFVAGFLANPLALMDAIHD